MEALCCCLGQGFEGKARATAVTRSLAREKLLDALRMALLCCQYQRTSAMAVELTIASSRLQKLCDGGGMAILRSVHERVGAAIFPVIDGRTVLKQQ